MDGRHDDGGAPTESRRLVFVRHLPKVSVTSRAQMANLLRKWRWLLERRALAELGDAAAAEEAVRTTRMRLLEIERPNHPHALRWILQTLRNECRAVRIRLAREARHPALPQPAAPHPSRR